MHRTSSPVRSACRLIPRFSLNALLFAAAVVLHGCGDDEPTTVIDSDADVGFVPCGGEQCMPDEYCQRPVGFCATAGNCEARPTECADEVQPVCGCDGKSYSNACVAAKLNRSVDKSGLCNEGDTPIDG